MLGSLLLAGCAWHGLKPDSDDAVRVASTTPVEIVDHASRPTVGESRTTAPEAPSARPAPAHEARPTGDLWQVLARGLEFDGLARAEVRKELAAYGRQRRYLSRVAHRAEPYLHFILDEITRRGLPGDLALLPILESGYQPGVVSPYGAAGLWQFMNGTGTKFGLVRTAWVDERLDVVASTRAALTYLESLHGRFDGDWLLAIAAYNAGWGNVERAIARNRRAGLPTDIWSLQVSPETHRLAARLLALSQVFRAPARFGIDLPPLQDRAYFHEITLRHPTDLRRLMQLSNIDEAEFRRLNPGFRRWHTGPTSAQRVLVPATSFEATARIATRLGPSRPPHHERVTDGPQVPGQSAPSFHTRTYVTRRGDSLWEIARKFATRVASLESLNGVSRHRPLRVGQRLQIPARGTTMQREATANVNRYRVRRGDSLWTISRQFNVTVKQLIAWNKGIDKSALRPGQELLVRNPS